MDKYGMKRSFWEKLKIAIICLLIFSTVCLISCSAPSSPDFPVPPFESNIQWSFNGTDFSASLSVCENSAELRLISPDCLSGANLLVNGDTVKYTYDGITLDSVPEYYLAIMQMFRETGKFKFLCHTEIDGQNVLCYLRENTEWYFSEQTKAPILAKREDISIKILKVK